MALQKKNEFTKSHLIVFATWYVLAIVLGGSVTFAMLQKHALFALLVIVTAILLPGGFFLTRRFLLTEEDVPLLRPSSHRHLNCTIGALPPPRLPLAPINIKNDPLVKTSWWAFYSKKHPLHAEVLRAVLAVMMSKPDLPASPVPGGHGGATLIQHSLNVVDVILEMVPHWTYQGHRNSRGEIVFPLIDLSLGEFRFSPDDPLPVLAAFAHDLGKVVCYEQRAGGVVEVKKYHDTEGAKILRAMPEVMSLPWPDRSALLLACEYYHKPQTLPETTWIDDRARALMELLIAADIETGRREEGGVASDHALKQPAEKETVPAPEAVPTTAPAVTPATVPAPAPKPEIGERPSAYDLTYSILMEGNRVNGTNASKRIAWKHGEWLYIHDPKLRAAVAERLNDNSYTVLSRGQMHPFTLELMEGLSKKGFLLQDFEGAHYSHKRAIFTTVSSVPGKSSVETKFVIIAKVEAFPILANVRDCKAPPRIVKCSWGEIAALNKKGDVSDDAALAEATDTAPQAEACPANDTPAQAVPENKQAEAAGPVVPEEVPGEKQSQTTAPVVAADAEIDPVHRLRLAVERNEIRFMTREMSGLTFFLVEEEVIASVLGIDEELRDCVGEELRYFMGKSGKQYYALRASN